MKLFLVAQLALTLHAAPTTSDALHLRVRLHRTREYAVSCADGTSEVSVIPWEEPGCAAGQLCIAARSDGACPEGASCSHVGVDASGNSVFGCVDTSILVGGVQAAASDDGGDVCDEEADETPMGVVGWEHNGCVTGDPCVASTSQGECPEEASCRAVGYAADNSDVYGCIANNSSARMEGDSGGPYAAGSSLSDSSSGSNGSNGSNASNCSNGSDEDGAEQVDAGSE